MNDDNVFRFRNFDDLKHEIENDLKNKSISANRFPVRFIFLNSHDELKKIVDLLSNGAKKQELSSFLYSDNSWFSEDQIINNIKRIDKDSIILPLSEYIRFLEDESFIKILGALAEIENPNLKLYIPLVGLWERFEKLFWRNFSRRDNWAPVWKLHTPPKHINIYQINFEFNKEIKTGNLELVSSIREWFELWKKEDIDNIISLPKPLSIFFKNSLPDQTFTQEIINTPKEYLSQIFGIDLGIEYDSNEFEFWINLLIDVSKCNQNNSFKDIFIEKFNINNVNNIKLEEYLNYYLQNASNPYKQWLIKNFFIEYKLFNNSYLYQCFNSIDKLDNKNLARKIFLQIFKLDYNYDFLNERRDLLKCLVKNGIVIPEQNFEDYFNKINDLKYKQKLNYLTNTTLIEKKKILEIICENGIENIISELEVIFPELYHYLDWNISFNELPSWIIDYFREYNMSKILNNKSEKLEELLDINNSHKNFYSWYYDVNNISNQIVEDSYVVWIDGLGVEWLPLFTYYLNEFGRNINKKVNYKSINSVNFPSSTEFNKPSFDEKISDLDKYIHDDHYKYPISLFDEMESIKRIAKQIVSIDSSRISIFSDHGFSCLCTKHFGCNKKYDFINSKHGGRYFLVENEDYEDTDDYICAETGSINHNKQKYVVALKHTSLYNTPSQEVHGGLTPEEILVPFIVIENNNDSLIEYDVYCSKSKINISKENELLFKIYPEPKHPIFAFCNNVMLEISEKGSNEYIIHLNNNLNKGKQKIILKCNNDKINELEINIVKGGFETNDDWF